MSENESKEYILMAPCIEHPQFRAKGITSEKDLEYFRRGLERCKHFGIGTVFLPCPECAYLGMERSPGSYLERLNTPEFEKILDTLEADVRDKYLSGNENQVPPLFIVGVDSSPTCAVNTTYYTSVKEKGRGAFLKRFLEIRAYDIKEFSMYRIYLAAPLFSEAERAYNERLAKILREKKFVVHLPQEIGDDSSTREDAKTRGIFEYNLKALNECDIVVAIIDGADADSGTSWEIGYAYASHKKIITLRTDFRRVGTNELVNLMLEESGSVAGSIDELLTILNSPF